MPSYQQPTPPQTQFSLLHRSLMQSKELPLQTLLSDQRIADIFAEEGVSFGEDEDAVYTPAITLWGLLSQVFFKAEQRSCLAAVVRIAALWLSLGREVSSTNTGAYCRARRQISAEVLRKISGTVAMHALEEAHGEEGTASFQAGGVVLICMRTGLLLDAEVGPYCGKQTGETALLWKLLVRCDPVTSSSPIPTTARTGCWPRAGGVACMS